MLENLVTEEHLKLIANKLNPVLQAGYGKVLIQVQHNQIVYISHEIGEQIRMELPNS